MSDHNAEHDTDFEAGPHAQDTEVAAKGLPTGDRASSGMTGMTGATGDPAPTKPVSDGARDRSPGLDFLLTEVETARVFVQFDVASSDKRIDLLLTIASALGAGLVILSQTHIAARDFLFLALIAFGSLAVIGLPILFEVIRSDANAIDHIRALNVIRNYFVIHYPEIEPGISMQRRADFPTYSALGQSRRLIPIALNALAGAGVGVVIYMINNKRTTLDYVAIVVAVVLFAVLSGLQQALALWRFRVIVRQIARSKRLDDRTTAKTRTPEAPSST